MTFLQALVVQYIEPLWRPLEVLAVWTLMGWLAPLAVYITYWAYLAYRDPTGIMFLGRRVDAVGYGDAVRDAVRFMDLNYEFNIQRGSCPLDGGLWWAPSIARFWIRILTWPVWLYQIPQGMRAYWVRCCWNAAGRPRDEHGRAKYKHSPYTWI